MSCQNCKRIYYYLLNEYEGSTMLCSYNKYTNEEFNKMCKEVPVGGSRNCKWYDSIAIKDHLEKKYDFFKPKIEQYFFIDADVD